MTLEKPPYQEGPDSTFRHMDKDYQLDPLLADAAKLPVKQVHTNQLEWNLRFGEPDPIRLKEADTRYPIIITEEPRFGWVILDGFHRFCKLIEQKRTTCSVRIIPREWLKRYRVSLENDSPITVGRATLDQAKAFLEPLGIIYNLPQMGAINYSDVPHQYTFAYQQEQPVGLLITTTVHNDFVSLNVNPEADYIHVGSRLLNSVRVNQVLVRTEDEALNSLLKYAGYRLAESLVKFNLYRKVFPASEFLSIQ